MQSGERHGTPGPEFLTDPFASCLTENFSNRARPTPRKQRLERPFVSGLISSSITPPRFHHRMKVILEPATDSRPLASARPSFARRLLVSAIRLAVTVLLAALLGGGWFLAHKGFGRQWRERVVEELHKHGVEVSVGHLTVNPFRGLVAQDVRIYDYKHREKTVALISEVSLDINYAALLHHRPFLNALDVRDAQLTLPMASGESQTGPAQLTNFRAHVYFPPAQIYVAQAEGLFCGVRLSATGQLIQREDAPPSSPLSEEEWQKRLALLQRLINELQKFNFPSPPSLQIKFGGDLAEMENARIEATLKADKARRDKYELHDFTASLEFSNQFLSLTRCQWSDAAGQFSAGGTWSRENNEARFQARSSIDLKGFLEAFGFGKLLSDLTFPAPPVLTTSGSVNLGAGQPQFKMIGNVTAPNFTYRSIAFSQLNANFSWDGARIFLRDVRVQNQGGQLNAEMLDAPNDFRLNIDSTVNPIALRAFVSPELQQFLTEWEWPRPPTVHLVIRGQDHRPGSWRGDGTIALERARFRGVWMNSAGATVRFGDGAVTYQDLRVVRNEGTGTGTFTSDFKKHEVRIVNLKTSLWPNDAVYWIDPKLARTVAPYKFRKPPDIMTNGVYQFAGGKNTRLELAVEGGGGMDYVFLGKTLPFEEISGNLLFTDDRLQINALKSVLFSGRVRGNADISLARNDSRYHANILVDHIDFARLTDLYYDYKTALGQLNGAYDFTGVGSEPRKMRGTGKLEVINGDVFALPIFGPLSGLLNAVLPGSMGYSIARKARATFTIRDGVSHTDDFEVAGRLFSMLGHGDIHFLDDKLDFNVRMSANGAAALLTPMYKLFEYTGEGSLKHPDWHPKRF